MQTVQRKIYFKILLYKSQQILISLKINKIYCFPRKCNVKLYHAKVYHKFVHFASRCTHVNIERIMLLLLQHYKYSSNLMRLRSCR